MFSISGNQLLIDSKFVIDFQLPILACQEVEDNFVVVLDVRKGGVSITENVYAISRDGRVLWQIERIPMNSTDPINYYTGVGRHAEGKIRLGNWNGSVVTVDVHSGKVLSCEGSK